MAGFKVGLSFLPVSGGSFAGFFLFSQFFGEELFGIVGIVGIVGGVDSGLAHAGLGGLTWLTWQGLELGLDFLDAVLPGGFGALGFVGGEEEAVVLFQEGFALFGFFLPEVVGHEPVGQALSQFAVGGAAVAGELVDAEVFVEIFEVVFLDPPVEHKEHDPADGPGGVAAQDADLDAFAVGVLGEDDDAEDPGVGGPGLAFPTEVIVPEVAGVVAVFAEGAAAGGGSGVPGGRLIAFFPCDEVDGGLVEDELKSFEAIDAAINDVGEGLVGAALEGGVEPASQGNEAAAQVFVVVATFKVDGLAGGGVEVVAIDEFVGPADGGAPAFEDGLVAGVVLGVGVEVEVGALRLEGGGLSLLVVPAEEAGLVARGGEGLEAGPLEGEGSGGGSDELAEILPVQKLGLLDVEGSKEEAGEPLLEEGFRRGDGLGDAAQGFGKEEESGVIVMTGFAGLQV